MALARFDTWVRSVMGPSAAGAQVYICTQPVNTSAVPPSPLASIFADPAGVTPVTQPLSCDGFGHTDAYLTAGIYTVVVVLSATVQHVYPDQTIGIPAGSALVLESNGVANASQGTLNLESTDSSVTITDEGAGTINLQAANGLALKVNGAPNASQTTLNLESTDSSVAITDLGSGNVNIQVTKPVGNNLVFIQNPESTASGLSGSATSCIMVRIPAGCLAAIGQKIQVTLTFDASSSGNFILSNSVVRRTVVGGTTFTDTANLTWSGSTTPTMNTSASKTFTSDSCAVTLDAQHDTYIILRVNPSTAGSVSCSVFPVATIAHCGAETTGTAYDTTASISVLSSLVSSLSAQSLLISSIVTSA